MSLRTYIILVFASLGSRLCMFAGHPLCHVTKYDEDDGLSQWRVTQIVQDEKGMMWMGTWNGLNRFDGQEFRCFKSRPGDNTGMTTNRVRNIWLTEEGNILCRIDEELFLFDTEQCTYRPLSAEEQTAWEEHLPRTKVAYSLLNKPLDYTDKQGNQWRLTNDGTLMWLNRATGRMEEYALAEPLPEVRFVWPDRQGNLWLVPTAGVCKLSFAECPIEELPGRGQVRCCFVDRQGRWWVTGRDDNSVRLYSPDNRLLGYLGSDGKLHSGYVPFDAPVYAMMQSRTGSIWMGCKPGGIWRLRPSRKEGTAFEMMHLPAGDGEKELTNGNVYGLCEDDRGRLWVATLGGGVNCIVGPESDSPRCISQRNGLTGYPSELCQKVRHIEITPDGNLLAATTEGLLVARIPEEKEGWEKMHFTLHRKESGREASLSCSATMQVMQDGQGRIWVPTESGGVNLLMTSNVTADTLEWRHCNRENGFPTDVTLAMACREDGRMWVVGANQIVVMEPDGGRAESYDAAFFRRKCRFSDARPVQLPDGRWLFGLQDGAFMLEAERLKKSDDCPPIALTGLSIENREVNPAVNGLDTLLMRPEERNLTLFFTALDYTDGVRTEYAFRLTGDGEESEWNGIGHNRSVTLLDMQPGTYRLDIRSTNADGVWVDNARTVVIIVTPTFWETGWALALWIVLGAGMLWAIAYTYIYIRRINRRQRETLAAYLALLDPAGQEVTERPADVAEEEVCPPLHTLTEEDKAFMQRVMAFVEEHLADADINVGDMAAATATSRSGLNRKMKSILGVTPLDFLREARIKNACRLLEEEGLNVSEVAYRCGFSDPKYFSRCFKGSVGVSPSEYKNR